MAVTGRAPIAVREGTATRRAGHNTAEKILKAARELLTQEGYARFSMRNVAKAASLHLANLQYYYPRRDDLVHALLADTGDYYQQQYQKLLACKPDDPEQRFVQILKFQIEDAFDSQTRNFFVQMWALLNTLDRNSGQLLTELYEYDVGPLANAISAMHPTLSKAVCRHRATLVAGMVEGLMIVRGDTKKTGRAGKALIRSACTLGLGIANAMESG